VAYYARIINGTVYEPPINLPAGLTPAEVLPAIAGEFVACDQTIQAGYTYNGTTFSAPAPAPPPSQSALSAYANAKQWALATGGYTVTIAGTALIFGTDVESRADLAGKVSRLAQPNPPASINWQFVSGFVTISAADFTTAAIEIADFFQATFDALKIVLAGIAAGTITTTAQIDAAAWPSNVSTVTA